MSPEDIAIQDLVDQTGTWAQATFPKSTDSSICEHLKREAQELADKPSDVEEAADCILLIFHLAHRRGWDLGKAIREKSAKNKSRIWNPVDAKGVSEHDRKSSV